MNLTVNFAADIAVVGFESMHSVDNYYCNLVTQQLYNIPNAS